MIEIILTVDKEKVYREVAKTTEYIGSKSQTDETDYDLVSTTDEDKEMLERFWNESKDLISDSLKKVLLEAKEMVATSTTFNLKLGLSGSFDSNLKDSMQSSLFSFFVTNIVSKWSTFTNKQESTDYAAEAAGYIEDIRKKAFFKKKPVRPTYI